MIDLIEVRVKITLSSNENHTTDEPESDGKE
jgi:hypothetical protein